MINFISLQFPLDPKSINSDDLQHINNVLHSIGLHCEKIPDKPQEQSVCQNKRSNLGVTQKMSSKSTRQGPASPGQLQYLHDLCAKQSKNLSNVVQERFHHGTDKLTNEESDTLINELK